MKYNQNLKQNLIQRNLRKQKQILNNNFLKEKIALKYDLTKERKKEKDKGTAIYKRRNIEYDIPIPSFKIVDSEIVKLNLEKNRSRNHANEGSGELYPGGITLFQNERKKYNNKVKIYSKFDNKNYLKTKNLKKMKIKDDNDSKLNSFKDQIISAVYESQKETQKVLLNALGIIYNSMNDSMNKLINGQKELIELTKKLINK